ncbi:hypothetical protein [Chromobacterium piscinae]|uniref:Uncharacterized protein n=1 Tax=Chromobacterium piscinae TaxID=686831 RepID=A0ABV0H2I9_9NEIS|nr:hypothetical protein [Chromobacterium piscinae]MBX9297604.1 hypothetical protein [Chromobacterium vaccinii]MBX9347486.1 hypothetical protein [Chromobacterium vaccinii]MBX9357769.1 hypothetical protein [Chromobacterium vaccinii]MCD4502979.1 hypothetical protein [Chromobacterium piscinae]MCD5328791.1 hypothetical protein [Chromobacterium piscinae]
MADGTLNPQLRQVAEQYLERPLEAEEEQQLLSLQQNIQSQPPAPLGATQQAKQQAQQAISQSQAKAGASVKDILQTIQTSSSKALQVQEAEEQAILKLLEGSKTLSELRPAAMQPMGNGLKPGSQLAMAQIADHLSNLARKEVENCFNQYFGPLNQQLQALVARLEAKEAAEAAAPDTPSAASSAQTDAQNVHKPQDPPSTEQH